ncbi:CPCC family cysteine-rich protein [Fulvivirga kasyanovii]|nr:CPCC family cysteine-rich protein [Fulvivirga kasyanovii]
MNRNAVLDIYIKNQIENFSEEEREEELYEVWGSNWSNVEGWEFLSSEIKESINNGTLPEDYKDKKYDSVLFFKFRDRFKGFRNDYLSIQTGLRINSGNPTKLESCPCCGMKTIEKRYDFEICTVCWWEDDGQDNENSDTILGGPNYGLSLTKGRLNFLRHGIYDPERNDLIEIKDEPNKFEKGRSFEIQNNFLIELGTEWKTKITNA